jgi:hypothetical protein
MPASKSALLVLADLTGWLYEALTLVATDMILSMGSTPFPNMQGLRPRVKDQICAKRAQAT